jgi:hypothetical protein
MEGLDLDGRITEIVNDIFPPSSMKEESGLFFADGSNSLFLKPNGRYGIVFDHIGGPEQFAIRSGQCMVLDWTFLLWGSADIELFNDLIWDGVQSNLSPIRSNIPSGIHHYFTLIREPIYVVPALESFPYDYGGVELFSITFRECIRNLASNDPAEDGDIYFDSNITTPTNNHLAWSITYDFLVNTFHRAWCKWKVGTNI